MQIILQLIYVLNKLAYSVRKPVCALDTLGLCTE